MPKANELIVSGMVFKTSTNFYDIDSLLCEIEKTTDDINVDEWRNESLHNEQFRDFIRKHYVGRVDIMLSEKHAAPSFARSGHEIIYDSREVEKIAIGRLDSEEKQWISTSEIRRHHGIPMWLASFANDRIRIFSQMDIQI